MRSLSGSLIWILILLLIDWYVFQALRTVGAQAAGRGRMWLYGTYWLVSLVTIGNVLLLPWMMAQPVRPGWAMYAVSILIGIFLAKLLVVVFLLVDDGRRLLVWLLGLIRPSDYRDTAGPAGEALSRSAFLSWLGLGAGSLLFGTLLAGFRNQYNYQVRRVRLSFDALPEAFRGLRLVHISDIHSGSFQNREAVLRGVELVNRQQPDLILFTGDLVNDRATEMEPFMDVFNRFRAPMGVYSTLGNHDYGDYAGWPSKEAKTANLEKLKEVHRQLGWRLLMDEGVLLERDGQTIGLAGVQNISGKANFHSYGDLSKALVGIAEQPFKILMSHDPSHWDAEVLRLHPDIHLTLSGHTHGMQFGVELPGFKWSPVQWVYRQWAGLYEQGNQKLYVNRGFGFIGYPGRVGILPEITVIELA